MALTGQGLANFCKSKVGTPYVYGAKGADGPLTQAKLDFLRGAYPGTITSSYYAKAKKYVGKVCTDCSGLISWYTKKVLGSSQMYSTASERHALNKYDTSSIPIGAVLWKSGHVGVYIGGGKVVEALGIDYGTVINNVSSRNFTHWLLFSYISYGSSTTVSPTKSKNPHPTPTRTLKKGHRGNDVRWLQYELVEAGYKIAIDGCFGSATDSAVRKFQKSSKLEVDGLVGKNTRNALIKN